MSEAEHQVEIPSDELFWELVALADRDWEAFEAELGKQSTPILAGFAAMYWQLASVFWQWAQDEGDCSEDSAEDVGGCLVARGREFFVAAIQAPKKIVTAKLMDSLDDTGLGIMYEAETQYRKRTGKEFTAACEGPYYNVDKSAYGPLIHKSLRS